MIFKKLTNVFVVGLPCLKMVKAKRIRQTASVATVLLCFFSNMPVWAQNDTKGFDEVRPLTVGAKIPETFWQQEHVVYQNGQYVKQNLSAYRNSLLILDYWATWCASCIIKFPELEQLQAKYPTTLKVLLINPVSYKDTPAKVEALFNARVLPFRNYTLPSVVSDTTLIKFFTPVMLPQNIWIIDGRVRAITSSEFTNANSVEVTLGVRDSVEATRQARKVKTNQKTKGSIDEQKN